MLSIVELKNAAFSIEVIDESGANETDFILEFWKEWFEILTIIYSVDL